MVNIMRKLIFEMQSDDLNIHKSSCFHGWIMEQIKEEYAEVLHSEQTRPFSQYLIKKGDKWEWHIQTFTETADLEIAEKLYKTDYSYIILEDCEKPINVLKKQWIEESLDDVLKKTYFQDSSRICNINFVTPVSFKRQDKYVIFPEVKLIFQNLINRFQACDYQLAIGDAELLREITERVQITDYQLRTRKFYLEKTGIKGFQGKMSLKIHGPQMFVNLIHFLLRFGCYSGVGIKTALGMGAMEILERR